MCEAHITSTKSLAAGVQGPLKGPGSSRVVEALWCYLSLIFYRMTTLNELHFNDKIMHILLNELLFKVCVCV